ncbi:MAG TPA: tetratricopeptide repeat protein [Polyangiaceae bacterium]|nr:tetratricopeptide repeat protein [Polyangiaceae bacterium]
MRLAIIATSTYSKSDELEELVSADADAEALARRLSEPDGGFEVRLLPAERGLADEMERVLREAREPIDALFVLFAGYATVTEEGFPALVLDGERLSTLSLRRLRRLLTEGIQSSFLVLDTVSAFGSVPDMVRRVHGVVAGEGEGIHLLAAHRDPDDDPTAFSSLFALVLDWHTAPEALGTDELFHAMRREESLFSSVRSAALYPARTPFFVLVPEALRARSLPPAPRMSSRPAPSGDAERRADAALAAGNLDDALAALGEALEGLGPEPSPRHAPLYVKTAGALHVAGRDEDALAYYEAALSVDDGSIAALQGAARLSIARGDRSRALGLLARWVLVDPNSLAALEQSAKLLGESESWGELAMLYEAALQRVTVPAVAAELALSLAALCRDKLGRPDRAVPALERAAELAPADVRVRRRVAELLDARGAALGALPHVVASIRLEPRAEDFRVALRLFDRSGRPDAAWNAACALEVLGDADVNESLLAAAHRPEGLLTVAEPLGEDQWNRRLFSTDRDSAIDSLVRGLGPALVDVGLETAQRKRRLVALDPSTAEDPQKSTATLFKVLGWSARLLGIPVPRVHLVDGLRVPFFAPPAREPTLVVSKALGSGLEMPALAFLWSRQLVFLRPEHLAVVFFPTAGELASLLLAALSLGGLPELPPKKLEGEAKLLFRSLRRAFPSDVPRELASVVRDFPVRESADRILSWGKTVELAAGRAGLLACGDLELAATLTKKFPLGGLVDPEKQVEDLLAFAISDEYAVLRDRIGVLVRSR